MSRTRRHPDDIFCVAWAGSTGRGAQKFIQRSRVKANGLGARVSRLVFVFSEDEGKVGGCRVDARKRWSGELGLEP